MIGKDFRKQAKCHSKKGRGFQTPPKVKSRKNNGSLPALVCFENRVLSKGALWV